MGFWDLVDFNKPLYKREPLISIRKNVNDITISLEEEMLKSTNWRCGGRGVETPSARPANSNKCDWHGSRLAGVLGGLPPRRRGRRQRSAAEGEASPFFLKIRRFFALLSL